MDSRTKQIVLIVLTCIFVYLVGRMAWPMSFGRDGGSYYAAYLGRNIIPPEDRPHVGLLLLRGELAMAVVGGLANLNVPALSAVMAVLFCLSILALHKGLAYLMPEPSKCPMIASIAVACYPAYSYQFHGLTADPINSVFVMLLFCFSASFYADEEDSWLKVFAFTPIAFMCLWFKPLSVFAFLVAMIFVRKFRFTVFMSLFFSFLVVSVLNLHEYDHFGVFRTGGQWPTYRTFVMDKSIRPENGNASTKLWIMVAHYTLAHTKYEGVSVDEFFEDATSDRFFDLIPSHDAFFGWKSDYKYMKAAAWEAIEAHPIRFAKGYLKTAFAYATREPEFEERGEFSYINKNNDGFTWAWATSPDGRLSAANMLDGSSNAVKNDERIWNAVNEKAFWLYEGSGIKDVATFLNCVTSAYPAMIVFFVFGVMFYGMKNPLFCFCVAGIITCAYCAAYAYCHTAYRIPFDPFFISFGISGLYRRMSE